jgi:hypothetical protein
MWEQDDYETFDEMWHKERAEWYLRRFDVVGDRFRQHATLVEKLLSQMLETEDRKKRLGYTYSQERIDELKQVLGK